MCAPLAKMLSSIVGSKRSAAPSEASGTASSLFSSFSSSATAYPLSVGLPIEPRPTSRGDSVYLRAESNIRTRVSKVDELHISQCSHRPSDGCLRPVNSSVRPHVQVLKHDDAEAAQPQFYRKGQRIS